MKFTKPSTKTNSIAQFSSAIDWRNMNGRNYVSPIKKQGYRSTCVAFGIIAALEISTRIKLNIPIKNSETEPFLTFSEWYLFYNSPGHKYNFSMFSHNSIIGWRVYDALSCLLSIGAISERLYSSKNSKKIRNIDDLNTKKTEITGFSCIKNKNDMKIWLSYKGPLIAVINMRIDFIFHKKGIYKNKYAPGFGRHCVCIIGYDEAKQAWLCKNSWGENWGEQGFFWIAYGELNIDSEMWAIDGIKTIYNP